MALEETDITILRDKIIARYELTNITAINDIVTEHIVYSDKYLEENYPSFYVGSLQGTTLHELDFIKAREFHVLCRLFTENADFLITFNQSKNINEVENSAGTRVRMNTVKLDPVQASDFCKLTKQLLIKIGALEAKSSIHFHSSNNVLA